MKTTNKIVMSLLMALPLTASAGDRAGNGGDVVICTDPTTGEKTYEVLDFWESRSTTRRTIDLGPSNLSVDEKVEIALKRLDRLDPAKAQDLRTRYLYLKTDFIKVNRAQIPEIKDSKPVVLPGKNCVMVQAAIQRSVINRLETKYLYDEDIWNKLSTDEQAGLHLHEIVYSMELDTRAVDNSDLIRPFVALISTQEMGSVIYTDYIEFIRKHLFSFYKVHGYEFNLKNTTLRDSKLEGGIMNKVVPWVTDVGELSMGEMSFLCEGGFYHPAVLNLITGKIEKCTIIKVARAGVQIDSTSYSNDPFLEKSENGNITISGKVNYGEDPRFHIKGTGRVVFDRDGSVKFVRVWDDIEWTWVREGKDHVIKDPDASIKFEITDKRVQKIMISCAEDFLMKNPDTDHVYKFDQAKYIPFFKIYRGYKKFVYEIDLSSEGKIVSVKKRRNK